MTKQGERKREKQVKEPLMRMTGCTGLGHSSYYSINGRRVNYINKPAATQPDASDNSMTEATSMLSIAKVTVWSHWQCNFLVIRLFDHQIGWSLLPILLSCTFVHRSYQRQESHLARLAKSHGANYGKPKPGSESEKRSIAYQVDY